MKRKIMAVCMVVIAVCSVLLWKENQAGRPVKAQEAKGLRVALSQAEPMTPWKTAQINSFLDAARAQGIELIYHEPEEETLSWQLEDIRRLFDEGIDYLVLMPIVRSGYEEALMEARERGVHVILAEQEVELEPERRKEDYYLTYVAPDYFKEGELCADILSEHFGIQPCNTMVIQGDKESTMSRERYMGFMHGVRVHSNMYISKRVESNGNRLTAQKATELTVADQEIDFNAVFAPSDEDGLGALQALKLADVQPGRDVALVSIGGIQDVVKAIITEEYLATVKSSPDYGRVVLDLVRRHDVGEVLERRVVIANQIYTIENAEVAFENAY